jgi:hypothetical protein
MAAGQLPLEDQDTDALSRLLKQRALEWLAIDPLAPGQGLI